MVPSILACIAGIYLGDVGLWALGRYGGRRVLAWRVAAKLPLATMERLGAWVDQHPGAAIVGSRFLPGTRLPLYIAAGIWGRRVGPILAWMLLAVAVWTPLLVLVTLAFGPMIARPLEGWFGAPWVSSSRRRGVDGDCYCDSDYHSPMPRSAHGWRRARRDGGAGSSGRGGC